MIKVIYCSWFAALVLLGCANKKELGTKVNEPFSGKKYESNDRYFRGVGKGESADQNISESKADLQAKKELAQQMSTTIKAVTDQYLGETEVNKASEINDKFQSLIREVTNTTMVDLRKIGQEQYIKEGNYTTYIAYEIHKRDMYKYMKKQAKLNKQLNESERKQIEEILDDEIKKMEALGDDK
jgi:hypothetical protein